jgi:hypothetical protein
MSLGRELFVRTDSYYFFGIGSPALGAGIIGLLAIAGLLFAIFRDRRRTWPLLLICAASVAVYAVAGNVIGVRRVIPLVICLGIFALLLLHSWTRSRSVWIRAAAYILFAAWLIIGGYEYFSVREGLASAEIALPKDFDFVVPPGETMARAIAHMVDGSLSLPADMSGYEPDRTLCILYVLESPNPKYSPNEIIAQTDRHGWSIPSTAPRFTGFRRRFQRFLARVARRD